MGVVKSRKLTVSVPMWTKIDYLELCIAGSWGEVNQLNCLQAQTTSDGDFQHMAKSNQQHFQRSCVLR